MLIWGFLKKILRSYYYKFVRKSNETIKPNYYMNTMHYLKATALKLLVPALLLLFGSIFQQAEATHVVGSDISYECVEGAPPGTFRIRLVLYRDCIGIPMCPGNCGAPCSRTVQIQGADPSCNGQTFGNVTVNLVNVRDVNPNPDCPTSKSTCTNMGCVTPGPFTPAVERYEFTGIVNLNQIGIPASCCNVRIVWQECCRNGAISTGASNQNFYMEAIVNRCLSSNPCNGSPQLSNDPYAFACGGQPFTFNNGAIDPDLDSLTYSFAPALQGPGASVTYIPPYSAQTPMPWTGPASGVFPAGISCDPNTGDIMFTAPMGGGGLIIGVMAIEVRQWRTINGVPTVIGITRRDIQMVVLQCPPNNPPRIATRPSNPGNQPRTSWSICAGDQLCFDIVAKDTDFLPPTISDTTKLGWNAALARFGATFTPNYNPTQRKLLGPREDDFKFCWQPAENLASTTPYYFTVTAKDNRCPLPGTITRAFNIRVLAKPDVLIQKIPSNCGKWAVRYNLPVNKPVQSFVLRTWQISKEPFDYAFINGSHQFNNVQQTSVINFTKGGKYLVMLNMASPGPAGSPPCIKTFYDTLTVDTPVAPSIRDTFVCIGNSVMLQARARFGKPAYQFRWFNSISDTIVPLNAPPLTIGNLMVAPAQTRKYTLQVRDQEGCRVYDSITVQVRRLPIGTLPDSTRLCFGDSVTMNPGNDGGRVRQFLWSTGDTLQQITRGDSNTYTVRLIDTSGCIQFDTMKVFVNRPIIPNAGLDTAICSGDTATLIGSGGQLYMWRNITTNTLLSPKSHNRTVRVNPVNVTVPTQYELTVYQSYPDTTSRYKECFNIDTVVVAVRPLPVLTRPQPVQACKSTNLINAPIFGVNQPGGVGIWSYPRAPGAIVNGAVIQFRVDSLKNIPNKDTIMSFDNWLVYRYTAPASFGGCTRTDSSIVRIFGNPRVNAGPTLIWCENGGIYNITSFNQKYLPTGNATQEEWTGNGIYSQVVGINRLHYFNPNLPGVIKSPGFNIQKYRYTHIYNASNPATRIDCANEDTVIFRVIEIPQIDAGSNIIVCKYEPEFIIGQKAGANTIPFTGASYWRPANTTINPAMRDTVPGAGGNGWSKFFAGSTAIPNPAPPAFPTNTVTYKMYYEDRSTGCLVRDSINLTVARVPQIDVVFSNPAADSPLVCLSKGDVFFNCFVNGNLNSNGVYGGSPAFIKNTSGTIPGNAIFNTLHSSVQPNNMMIYSWTDKSTQAECVSSDTVYIRTQVPPTISVTPGGAICAYDDTIAVSVASIGTGYTHTWSVMAPGSGAFTNDQAMATSYRPSTSDKTAGTIWVKATTNPKEKCPVVSDSTQLTINPVPTANALNDTAGCLPITANFVAGPTNIATPVNYSWRWITPGGGTSSANSISRSFATYQNNGLHVGELTVTSQVGNCIDIDTFTVRTHAVPKADFSMDPPNGKTTIAKPFFNYYDQSTVEDNSNMSFLWMLGPELFDSTKIRTSTERNPMNIEYNPDVGGRDIWLKVTTEHGCVDSTSRRIVIDPDITVFIPNAFFPGSGVNCRDGELCNRVFKVAADGHLSIEIFIFNRWGQQVYYSKDAEEGWNGKMNNGKDGGQDCPQEVYIYQVNATSFNGKQYRYSGSVTLLR